MKIINTSQAMPKPGRYVLAWMEGAKIPMRAMWAAQHTLPLGDDADPEWGEYSEEKDEYFCPAGWYEMNQHEEQHWGVDGNVVAWCELPRLDAVAAPAAVAPQGEYPQLPEGVMCIEQVGGEVIGRPTDYGFKHGRGIVHGAELFTSEQLRAYFDLGRQSAPAAPALEAPAAPPVPVDEFRGDTPSLVRNIVALLELDADGALVPHGVGGHARGLLSAAAARLAAAPQAPAAPAVGAETIHLQDLKNALAECTALRQQLRLMDEQQAGSIWRWQADGQDQIETMGARMGVLIYASDLRALLAREPMKPQQPAGMTSINARLSFNHGWTAAERAHGIRPEIYPAAQAKEGGAA